MVGLFVGQKLHGAVVNDGASEVNVDGMSVCMFVREVVVGMVAYVKVVDDKVMVTGL